jgi:hypothetical protein
VPSFDIKGARQLLAAAPAPSAPQQFQARGLKPYVVLAVGLLAAAYGLDAFFSHRAAAPVVVAAAKSYASALTVAMSETSPVVLAATPAPAPVEASVEPPAAAAAPSDQSDRPAEAVASVAVPSPAIPIPFYKPAPSEP